MKKLILSLLLLIPSISYADTATTGNPALILISTGSEDKRRNWGDKINENFSMLSATISAILAGGVVSGGSQSSFAGSKATGAVEMNGFSINNSSGFTLGNGGYITFPDGTTMSSSSGSGVSRIIQGSNISISPADGRGEVTINSTGGSGGVADGSNAGDLTELDSNGDIMPSLVTFANDVNSDLDSNNQIMFKPYVVSFGANIVIAGLWATDSPSFDFMPRD